MIAIVETTSKWGVEKCSAGLDAPSIAAITRRQTSHKDTSEGPGSTLHPPQRNMTLPSAAPAGMFDGRTDLSLTGCQCGTRDPESLGRGVMRKSRRPPGRGSHGLWASGSPAGNDHLAHDLVARACMPRCRVQLR